MKYTKIVATMAGAVVKGLTVLPKNTPLREVGAF